METPRQAFREYDIRGVAERDLNDELVCALGRALASQLSGESSSPRLRCRHLVRPLQIQIVVGWQISQRNRDHRVRRIDSQLVEVLI